MSRILFINSVCNGSTGTICKQLYSAAEKEGHECCIAYGRGNKPEGFNTIKIGNDFDTYMHVVRARLFDASGFGSKRATKQFIKDIEDFKPDIIHLHNIHGYYINIEILFKYLKEHPEIKKIWTLHDCWAFTGHCAYYTYYKCDKWKKGCKGNCINKNEYPKSILSNIEKNYKRKKESFIGVENMVLISPSEWLKKEVHVSFLKEYKVETIHNGVDTNVFKHVNSNIEDKYSIKNKKIILGVASVWDRRKGLDVFIELSKVLEDEYKVVLIGLSEKQIRIIPNNVIGIKRTENVNELVEWYSAAYIYFNPTLEDNYPTTNLEAIACGTPVVTFDTGGSVESAFIDTSDLNSNSNIKEIINAIKYRKPDCDFDCSKISFKIMEKSYMYLYERKTV